MSGDLEDECSLGGPGPGDGQQERDTVEINIKSPAAHFQDIRLDCPTNWSVARLKQKISDNLQFTISPKKQRLVYAGRILDDTEELKNLIRFQDECSVYTILLVSSEPYKATSPSNEKEPEVRRRRPDPRPTSSLENNTVGSSNVELNSWASEYFQLSNQLQSSQEPAQQMAALQEMYGQYLMQYMHYLQTSSTQFTQAGVLQSYFQSLSTETPRTDASTGAINDGRATIPQPVADTNPVVQPPRPERQAAPAAAIGGVDEQADGGGGGEQRQRDALDWVYSCVRMLFLVSLVYFYSSLPRFLLVLAIFLAFQYFQREGNNQERQTGQERLNQEERNNIQLQVNNIRDNMQHQANQGQETNNDEEGAEDETPGPAWRWTDEEPADLRGDQLGSQPADHQNGEQQEIMEENPDILRTVSTFIISFFTSLLPEPTNQLID